ncbi:MAG: type II toxin-antitoxin system RelE/ParE family toxin [Candidatus Altiarchaeota archaeon]
MKRSRIQVPKKVKIYRPARSNLFREDYAAIIRKNKALQERIDKKLLQILKNPEAYKPLKSPLQGYRRVQVGSFVITFRIQGDLVRYVRIAHHDKIYSLFHD